MTPVNPRQECTGEEGDDLKGKRLVAVSNVVLRTFWADLDQGCCDVSQGQVGEYGA